MTAGALLCTSVLATPVARAEDEDGGGLCEMPDDASSLDSGLFLGCAFEGVVSGAKQAGFALMTKFGTGVLSAVLNAYVPGLAGILGFGDGPSKDTQMILDAIEGNRELIRDFWDYVAEQSQREQLITFETFESRYRSWLEQDGAKKYQPSQLAEHSDLRGELRHALKMMKLKVDPGDARLSNLHSYMTLLALAVDMERQHVMLTTLEPVSQSNAMIGFDVRAWYEAQPAAFRAEIDANMEAEFRRLTYELLIGSGRNGLFYDLEELSRDIVLSADLTLGEEKRSYERIRDGECEPWRRPYNEAPEEFARACKFGAWRYQATEYVSHTRREEYGKGDLEGWRDGWLLSEDAYRENFFIVDISEQPEVCSEDSAAIPFCEVFEHKLGAVLPEGCHPVRASFDNFAQTYCGLDDALEAHRNDIHERRLMQAYAPIRPVLDALYDQARPGGHRPIFAADRDIEAFLFDDWQGAGRAASRLMFAAGVRDGYLRHRFATFAMVEGRAGVDEVMDAAAAFPDYMSATGHGAEAFGEVTSRYYREAQSLESVFRGRPAAKLMAVLN